MKIQSIKSHLKSYKIFEKRMTTVNHAFASSIAPNDDYDEDKIKKAIKFIFKLKRYCIFRLRLHPHLIRFINKVTRFAKFFFILETSHKLSF